MHAIHLHARGGPEALVYEQAPDPQPAPGEVLIRVHAAAVTPTELTWLPTWTTRTGAPRQLPVIPGHEFSGQVEAVGLGVADLDVGDAIYGMNDWFIDGAQAERLAVDRPPSHQRLVLLHSGTLYPTVDRDPSAFFDALANLRQAGKITAANLQVVLRATGYDDHYRHLIEKKGLGDIVTLAPSLPYREALAEMLYADGLLIFQGYTSNPAIPAKLYEYFRARRPIFALVDPDGDTAQTLRAAKIGTLVPLASEPAITSGLLEFLELVKSNQAPVLDPATMQTHSREYRARELATLLDMVACYALC
jgi:hypothetical protein